MNYNFKGTKLVIEEIEFIFKSEIWNILDYNNLILILLKPQNENNNVYCIDKINRKLLWQIKNESEVYCPITYIDIKDNFFLLNSFCSYLLIVEPETGQIIYKKFDNAK